MTVSVSEQLEEMRRWLDGASIRASDLHAVRVLRGRVTFSATFEHAIDADLFLEAFGNLD